MNDYTLVLGVDHDHLVQLFYSSQTWRRFKPSLLRRPVVVFFDRDEVSPGQIQKALGNVPELTCVAWPPLDVEYPIGTNGKWDDRQRYKMLAGFVHVPAQYVTTPYWLKLDTDVIATGKNDWVDPKWFSSLPAIVSQRWGYTKPPDQMVKLDEWAQDAADQGHYFGLPPLRLHPRPGASSLSHKRIISWCAFFNTEATRCASLIAEATCGEGKLPVPSQDGFIWYHAARQGWPIIRVQMKGLGWKHTNKTANVIAATEGVLS